MHSHPDRDSDCPWPADWHPQNWILAIEVLCWFESDDLVDDHDAEAAHRLVDGIAAEQGLDASDLLLQTDRT
ncbi:hypothetical protein [Halalkalicoccus salilacus]|uniref:hypothetical protein n=1 Tax=Halalkalicoccus TaxID=332246 RepID=UPI002F968080